MRTLFEKFFLSGSDFRSKLENAIIFSIVLFVLKIIFPVQSVFELIISEVFIIVTVYLWAGYIIGVIARKKVLSIPLILNAGIISALIFFILSVATSFFNDDFQFSLQENIVSSIFILFLIFIFIYCVIYIFTVLRHLFFLRQKNEPGKYFTTMLVFFLLAAFSNTLLKIDPSTDYISKSLFFVSILLIIVNSIRVSWIAFLPKKQKLYLLLISVIMSALFNLNYAFSFDNVFINKVILPFSPSFHTFFGLVMIYGGIYFGVVFFTTLFHLPTAEAFDRKAVEVSSLIDLSKLMTKVFDVKELGETIIDMTINVCNSDSSWLMVKKNGEFEIISMKNIGFVEANSISEKILIERKSEIKELILLQSDEISFKFKDQLLDSQFKSLAAAPLYIHNELKGILFTARKSQVQYDDEELKTIGSFADYAALALDNAKLIEESLIKERLEKELDVAREIQYKILPVDTPVCEKFEISAMFIPAFEVGGDYYDFFQLTEDKLGFVIADVSGKGISAAFIMAEVKGIFETLSKLIISPAEILIKANDILMNSLERKSFVTAIYCVLDTKTGKLKFARAGHTPLLHVGSNKSEQLTPAGMGLGLDYTGNFANTIKEMEIQLNYNDILALYTDGIPESKNASLEDFGYTRFEDLVTRHKDAGLDQISNEIIKDVSTFSQTNIQHDDITLVLLKWKFNN